MRTLILVLVFLTSSPNISIGQSGRQSIDLNVAIFAYLPDASTALEQIEERFERRYPGIDLDLELWNPYDDQFEEDGLSQIVNFDVVEIDSCRIDELIAGKFGGIDEIPIEARAEADALVGPAKTIAATEIGRHLVPHWVCGNFLVYRKDNTDVNNATTFEKFLAAVGPDLNRPLLTTMWSKTGLGEFYADALIDTNGAEAARKHLVALCKGETEIDVKARDAVVDLSKNLSELNRSNLEHFSNHSYVLPRQFAMDPKSVLLGYSERLYYTEREFQIDPKNKIPHVSQSDVCIKQFSFANGSKGTPTWTDGFVIPKGRTNTKRAAIAAFLQFIQSEDAYLAFAEPAKYLAPSYLLPAVAIAYEEESPIVKKQPLLPLYNAALDGSFPVSDSTTWQGMRKAGGVIRDILSTP